MLISSEIHSLGLAYLQLGNLHSVNDSRMGGALYAQVIDIQAQGMESNPQIYASYVETAAREAREFNPNVVVIAGLSTNPYDPPVTPQELLQNYQLTRSYVNGYWINVPSPCISCPKCNPSDSSVALAFLEMLDNYTS